MSGREHMPSCAGYDARTPADGVICPGGTATIGLEPGDVPYYAYEC